MSATLKYPSKVRITMGSKFFTYQGKQVGFVRKMVDDVILVEDAWVNEVRLYLGKNGYDTLLEMVARVLSAGGHPPVTRAQAWIILSELLKDGVPEVLQNTSADEVSNKGNLFATMKNTTASAIDSVANPVGSVVGRGMNIVKKNKPASDTQGDKSGE
jgi:hypothetical protein